MRGSGRLRGRMKRGVTRADIVGRRGVQSWTSTHAAWVRAVDTVKLGHSVVVSGAGELSFSDRGPSFGSQFLVGLVGPRRGLAAAADRNRKLVRSSSWILAADHGASARVGVVTAKCRRARVLDSLGPNACPECSSSFAVGIRTLRYLSQGRSTPICAPRQTKRTQNGRVETHARTGNYQWSSG